MNTTKRKNDQINYSNRKKQNADFVGKDLRRSNCISSDFTGSDFSHVSFRGAHFKACNFNSCTFEASEFVAANLKNSRFVNATFKNAIFDTANLEGANFEGATFENVIFIFTDTTKALNLDIHAKGIRVLGGWPDVAISEKLERAIRACMKNEFIKFAHVLDSKHVAISPLSVMLLLENFTEAELIKGLALLKDHVDKNFGTLSYLIHLLKTYQVDELI